MNIAPPGYLYVTIIPIQQFLDITNSYNPTENDVNSFTFTDTQAGFPGSYTFYYKTQSQPCYCTVLNDYYVIFDSYDSTQDSTLQASKTMCYGEIIPYWTMTDTFIPNIDDNQVPLLLNEAKSLAFFELKQTSHSKAEQEARRQWTSVQKDKAKIDTQSYFDQLPDFGRNARGGGFATPSYFKLRGWDRP